MNHLRGETCKKGRETGEEGACVPRFWQFGEQQFGFRVVFIGPQVFKTKDANDSEGLGYGLLVPAGLWSMCWSLCPYESVTPNACSWRSLFWAAWRWPPTASTEPSPMNGTICRVLITPEECVIPQTGRAVGASSSTSILGL